MRSRVVSAVIAATAMLATACSSSSDSTTEQKPSSTPTSAAASATEAAAMRGAPQVGTCWNIPPSGFKAGHRFNDSPEVACTKPHTTETVYVQKVPDPTVQAANDFQDSCGIAAGRYVGRVDYWYPVTGLDWLPSKKQVAAGASWIRCDVGFPRDWADIIGAKFDNKYEQSLRTYSAKDATTKHAADLLACLQRDPQIFNQWFVPCGKSHIYEETGQIAKLESLDSYPPPSQLRRATAQCRDNLPAKEQTAAFEVTAGWQPPEAFPGYIAHLYGVCFVYRQDGAPLPPRT